MVLSSGLSIRAEEEQDWVGVQAVHESAFGRSAEARLVAMLRGQARPVLSLLAENTGVIVGHIMLSPVVLSGHPQRQIMGLAPLAVVPARQRRGIGSALVRTGFEQCQHLGFEAVVVLGHPVYYRRFGFTPAARFGIGCEYDVPEEAFMVVELRSGCLSGVSGKVAYHAAFSAMSRCAPPSRAGKPMQEASQEDGR